jgi:hypothetical protein
MQPVSYTNKLAMSRRIYVIALIMMLPAFLVHRYRRYRPPICYFVKTLKGINAVKEKRDSRNEFLASQSRSPGRNLLMLRCSLVALLAYSGVIGMEEKKDYQGCASMPCVLGEHGTLIGVSSLSQTQTTKTTCPCRTFHQPLIA